MHASVRKKHMLIEFASLRDAEHVKIYCPDASLTRALLSPKFELDL
jgi:hypothetical protein